MEPGRTGTAKIIIWPGHPEETEPKKAKERGPAVGGRSAKVDTQLDEGVSDQEAAKVLQSAPDILQRCPEAFRAGVARVKWQIKKNKTYHLLH